MTPPKKSVKRIVFLIWAILLVVFICLAAANVFTDEVRNYGLLFMTGTYVVFWYLLFRENCQIIDTWLKREVWKE